MLAIGPRFLSPSKLAQSWSRGYTSFQEEEEEHSLFRLKFTSGTPAWVVGGRAIAELGTPTEEDSLERTKHCVRRMLPLNACEDPGSKLSPKGCLLVFWNLVERSGPEKQEPHQICNGDHPRKPCVTSGPPCS